MLRKPLTILVRGYHANDITYLVSSRNGGSRKLSEYRLDFSDIAAL
jgi:hypothetical protein